MVMARHDDEGQQPVALVGKVQECILDDFGLPVIGQMVDRRLAVQQIDDESEQQLMLSMFPIRLRQMVRFGAHIEFVAILVDSRQTGRGKAAV